MEKSSSWFEIQSGFAEIAGPSLAGTVRGACWAGAPAGKAGSGICKPPATCWFFVTLSRPSKGGWYPGLMVRDARRGRVPHHEGKMPTERRTEDLILEEPAFGRASRRMKP